MSDFIFSKKCKDKGYLSEKLRNAYGSNNIKTFEYHCQYGSIAYCENHYNGFAAYNTTDLLFIVVGGPILNFRDNDFLSKKGGNDGTIAIYNRWKNENKIVWDKDLSGPFVIFNFNKKDGNIELVTDMMSFIPVYSNLLSEDLVIGTHIDTIAQINNNSLDKVSVADFILHEIVTFPYTIIEGIIQLNPGTIYKWVSGILSNTYYWLPREEESDKNIKDIANELNKSFNNYISTIINSKAKIATFISGGEDSRLVLSAIPEEYPKDSFIFVDGLNHETSVAKKVTKKLNTKIIIKERQADHYWNIMKPACDLIGLCGDYAHVHTYNFHICCSLDSYDVVLGGFLADTLLKGHHVMKKRLPNILRFLPIPETSIDYNFDYSFSKNSFLNSKIILAVKERRKKHFLRVKELRPKSAKEWFNIWPISMHNDMPNIYGNRRLFRSYEPFTDSEIIKIASNTPQHFKLNRRLFQKAFKILYGKTKFIPHGSGYYPVLPWYFNNSILSINKTLKQIKKKIKNDHKSEGSWSNWENLMKSNNGRKFAHEYRSILEKELKSIVKSDLSFDIINNPNFTTTQKRIIIQLGYHFSKSEHLTK